VDEQYGAAGRRFIRRLVDEAAHDEPALRASIAERFEWYLEKAAQEVGTGGSARVSKLFAITYVAGLLARKWHILPKCWGSLSEAILAVQHSVEGDQTVSPAEAALDKVRAYVEENRKDLIDFAKADGPYDAADFQECAGFLRQRNGHREVLIPSGRFQGKFPDHRAMMADLRKAGRARTEGGKKPKLTIKAPAGLCEGGRVYCIRID